MTSPVFFVKPVWQEDATAAACNACQENFTVTRRRHHCRACGKIFCADCSAFKVELPAQFEYTGPERVCNACKEGLVKNIEGKSWNYNVASMLSLLKTGCIFTIIIYS